MMSGYIKYIWCLLLLFVIGPYTIAQSKTGYLTADGTWCWFSDPRAIKVDDRVITGWVRADGTIEAASLDIHSARIQTSELYFLLEADDHDNPAFVLNEQGAVIAMYTRHGRKDLFFNTLLSDQDNFTFSGAQLIHPWSADELNKFPRQAMSSANPIRLEGGNTGR